MCGHVIMQRVSSSKDQEIQDKIDDDVVASSKRVKRSSEEEAEMKRGRLGSDTSDSTLKLVFKKEGRTRSGRYTVTQVETEEASTPKMASEDLMDKIVQAMMSQKVSDHWIAKFEGAMDKKISKSCDQ